LRRALTCACTCLYRAMISVFPIPRRCIFAQGTDMCVYVPLQGGLWNRKNSALHIASKNGLESAVAKLLSLGADAELKDEVRACSHRNTCMCSVHVCIQRAFAARER
jgi:hypothetical protein